ncbi:MAG: glycosyltransferase family A protein, partial [Thermodesulfobacteriota bacterium]|nr:glycosyltransferase family A protein [Thermodesulfobacteriota bacterium]
MDTISIIIPTYNRPADLNRCLVSILNQTVPPLEVMVIDDGNLADPPLMDAVLRRGIEYLYHKKEASERGLTKSRNWGVKKAKGDIILFLDDDVELLPDYIEILLKVYKNYPEVAGAGGYNQKSKPLKKIWLLYDIAFCLAGFKEGYFLPSGF